MQSGDLMVFFGVDFSGEWNNPPAGWTEAVTEHQWQQVSQSYWGALDWKVATSTDLNQPITWQSILGAGQLQFPKGIIRVYRGENGSAPVAQATNAVSVATPTALAIPAMAAEDQNNEEYVGFWANGAVTTIVPTPSPGDLGHTTADQTQFSSFEGDKALPSATASPPAETAQGAASAFQGWVAAALVIRGNNACGTASATPTGTPTPTASPTGGPTPVPGYAGSWMGNSFGLTGYIGGVTGPGVYAYGPAHVLQAGEDLAVLTDGTQIVNARWDEGGGQLTMFKNGRVIKLMDCAGVAPPPHGWGGFAVTTNGNYIYAAQNTGYPPTQYINYVGKWNLDGTYSVGMGLGGKCSNLQTVDASPTGTNWIYGLAANATEVFVADAAHVAGTCANGCIKIYDAGTLAFKRQWAFSEPRRIAWDSFTNTLWISQGTTNFPNGTFQGNIQHFNINGGQLAGTISSVVKPSALSINPGNGTLYVADDGPDQQIKEFNSSGVQTGTFGAQGGYLSGTPGIMSSSKLIRPNGIGFDNSANLYVMGGGTADDDGVTNLNGLDFAHDWTNDIREYNSGGTLLYDLKAANSWQGTAAPDAATDGADFYTVLEHFKFDYSKLTQGAGYGGQEWSWYSHTLDPFTYPHDPRHYAHFPNVVNVQNIGGNKYLTTSDQYSSNLLLFHMVGEIAKPMAVFASKWGDTAPMWPNAPSRTWFWQDTNNNGEPDAGEFVNGAAGLVSSGNKWWDLDANGDVWTAYVGGSGFIGRYPHGGPNANGQLTYDTTAFISYGQPAPFNNVSAVHYDAASDTLYVSGWTAGLPPFSATAPQNVAENQLQSSGSVWCRYPNFVIGGNRTADLTINLQRDAGNYIFVRPWAVAGGKLFAGNMVTQYTNQNNTTAAHNIYVYSLTNGALLGEMLPAVENNSDIGWLDQNQTLTAYQRTGTSEYVITEENQTTAGPVVLRGMLSTFTQY